MWLQTFFFLEVNVVTGVWLRAEFFFAFFLPMGFVSGLMRVFVTDAYEYYQVKIGLRKPINPDV